MIKQIYIDIQSDASSDLFNILSEFTVGVGIGVAVGSLCIVGAVIVIIVPIRRYVGIVLLLIDT